MKLTKNLSTAVKIIDTLSDRKGFDAWWDNISRGCQQDIVNQIADIIEDNESRDQD